MSFPPNHFARPLRHRPVRSWRPLQGLVKALRWLVDRLARPVVIGTIVVLCWTVFVGVQLLAAYQPPVAWTLVVFAFGFACGLAWRDRRRKALAVVSEWHDEEIDGIKRADTIADVESEACGMCGRTPAAGLAYVEGVRYCYGPDEYCHKRASRVESTQDRLLALNMERWSRLPEPSDGEAIPAPAGHYDWATETPQVAVVRVSAMETGDEWCARCLGRGGFNGEPDKGLPWMQCPDCAGAGGHWGQA